MKDYWSIPGPSKAPRSACVAFHKYDGQNTRWEWSKKQGWHKFGSRKKLFDHTDEEFGPSIEIFEKTLAEPLVKTVRDDKDYRGVDRFSVFCEWHGDRSFCGRHHPEDEMKLTVIDVNIYRKGIVLPRDFIRKFGHLNIAPVVYEGNFNRQFIMDVKEGKYGSEGFEGVVAKGVILGKKKNPQHGLWMSKVKTDWWFQEIRKRVAEDPDFFKRVLEDNETEQIFTE